MARQLGRIIPYEVHYPVREIFRKSRKRKLINISKDVAHRLNKEFGIPFSCYEGISRSKSRHGKHSKYYLSESKYNLSCYNKLQNK